jgi:hypothetical protein
MTKIIPRNLIQHLEWQPGQEHSTPPAPEQLNPVSITSQYSVDDIIDGRTFFSNQRDGSKWVGVKVALQDALDYTGDNGIIATMPELIAAKLNADENHDFWKKWHTVHTEENIGIDTNGSFYGRNDPVLVVVNGGGILTPDRIQQAYDDGLVNNSAKYSQEEFDNLLQGRLPNGDSIQLHNFEEIKQGISNLPHRFGVVMPYALAQETVSGRQAKNIFLENPLVIARNGGIENLENYYERAKDSNGNLGGYHPFSGRDPTQAQGRVLYLSNGGDGLGGSGLINDGRFVGVAPEVPR